MTKNQEAKIRCLKIANEKGYTFKKFGREIAIYYSGDLILSACTWTRVEKLLEAHQFIESASLYLGGMVFFCQQYKMQVIQCKQ